MSLIDSIAGTVVSWALDNGVTLAFCVWLLYFVVSMYRRFWARRSGSADLIALYVLRRLRPLPGIAVSFEQRAANVKQFGEARSK